MAQHDIPTIAQNCTKFLSSHGRKSVREMVDGVSASPLSLERGDHYGKGGVVTDLEIRCAELLGKEAAVFMPSGVMAQLIALRIWSDQSGVRRVAFHPKCHLEIHEEDAYRHLHQLESVLLAEPDRLFSLEDLEAIPLPISTLLIELPQREIGGVLPTWDELTSICDWARERGIRLHADGARLWECQPFFDRSYAEIAGLFDSVYASFYKVLGGFPGAILAGTESFVQEARIWQRRHGGNLHQQSVNAITAQLGLDHHLPKIPLYVAKAAEIAEVLRSFDRINITPEFPPTNMFHLTISGDAERLTEAAIDIAKRYRVALFFGLGENNKIEISVGEGALELSKEEVKSLFEELFAKA